jgi:hypothetical protein
MTLITRSLDLVLWGLGAAAWGLATFALASRFISPTVGGLLGLAVGVSGMAFVINSHLRDARLESLSHGICPKCGTPVRMEHRHRSWDPGTKSWAAPSTGWECAKCGFNHSESWPCPQCPAP